MSDNVDGISNAPINDWIGSTGNTSVGRQIHDSIRRIGSENNVQAISQDAFSGFEREIHKIAGAMNDFISEVNRAAIDLSSAALAMIDPDAYDDPETKTEGSPDTMRAHEEGGGPSTMSAGIEACAKKFSEMRDNSAGALNSFSETLKNMKGRIKAEKAERAKVGDDAGMDALDSLDKKIRGAVYVVDAPRKHLDTLTLLSDGLVCAVLQSDQRAAMTSLAEFLTESLNSIDSLIYVDKLNDGAGVQNNNLPDQRNDAEDQQIFELRKMLGVFRCVVERLPQYGIDESDEGGGRFDVALDYISSYRMGELEKVRHSPLKRASDIYSNYEVKEYQRKIAELESKIRVAVLDLISALERKGGKSDGTVNLAISIVREEFNKFEAMREPMERKIGELLPRLKALRKECDDVEECGASDKILTFEVNARSVTNELEFAMERGRWADDLARNAANSAIPRWFAIGTLNNVRGRAVKEVIKPLQERISHLSTMCRHTGEEMKGVTWEGDPNAIRSFGDDANALKRDVERLKEDIDLFVGHKAFRGRQIKQLREVIEPFGDLWGEADELVRSFNERVKSFDNDRKAAA